MEELNPAEKARELASKIDDNFFENDFKRNISNLQTLLKSNQGKDLSKNELTRLLNFAVAMPFIEDITITPKMQEFCNIITDAKSSCIAMHVQQLIEEGQQQAKAEETAPIFQGEENGEE